MIAKAVEQGNALWQRTAEEGGTVAWVDQLERAPPWGPMCQRNASIEHDRAAHILAKTGALTNLAASRLWVVGVEVSIAIVVGQKQQFAVHPGA